MILFKGKKYKYITTMDITLEHVLAVFFPRNFYQKYIYLGNIPFENKTELSLCIEPLVIYMDYKVKPWWCPRWFLRLLHLFGNDNSIIKVRNRKIHNLFIKLTKGYIILDYKTKWEYYDLRISLVGDEQCHFLASAIEAKFYNLGLRDSLAQQIKRLDPNTNFNKNYGTESLRKELQRLEKKK